MKKGFNVKPQNLKVAPESEGGTSLKGFATGGGQKFYPTEQWKEIPSDLAAPQGCEYKMDVSTGKSFVRLTPGYKVKGNMSEGTAVDLNAAISWGDIAQCKAILGGGGKKPSKEILGKAIHQAAKLGNVEIVQLLLTKGADPGFKNQANMTAFHCAMNEG